MSEYLPTELAPEADPQGERKSCAEALTRLLGQARWLREQANGEPLTASRRLRLRAWQAARLAQTHRDLLDSPRYTKAAEFFLSDLYGPKDFTARDGEVERILPLMTSMLPVSGLKTVLLAVELDALSEQLDAAMVDTLGQILDRGLSGEDYAEAYRTVGQRPLRERQVILIRDTGEALDALAHKSFVRGALKMMHGPAQLAGLGELHQFLVRGFEAFRSMRDADEFLDSIVERESAILRALFAGRSDPFGRQ